MDIKEMLSNLLDLLEDKDMFRQRNRICGVIEGVMLGSGILEPGVTFKYEQVIVENPSVFSPWFPGTKPTITRKEHYHEMIIRITKFYISLPEKT